MAVHDIAARRDEPLARGGCLQVTGTPTDAAAAAAAVCNLRDRQYDRHLTGQEELSSQLDNNKKEEKGVSSLNIHLCLQLLLLVHTTLYTFILYSVCMLYWHYNGIRLGVKYSFQYFNYKYKYNF